MTILIPLAGNGSRFKDAGYTEPKPFIKVHGVSMIESVILDMEVGNKFIFIINTQQITEDNFREKIESLFLPYQVITVDHVTEGPACTALLAKELINNDEPLIIVNCDQLIHDFSMSTFEEFCKVNDADGVLGCFLSSSPKNSYLKLDANGHVTEVKEKIVISNIATNGLHYWKHGRLFVESAEQMIAVNDRYNNEFYIAPSYNYLLKNHVIVPYFFNLHWPIGTPEDLNKYIDAYK